MASEVIHPVQPLPLFARGLFAILLRSDISWRSVHSAPSNVRGLQGAGMDFGRLAVRESFFSPPLSDSSAVLSPIASTRLQNPQMLSALNASVSLYLLAENMA